MMKTILFLNGIGSLTHNTSSFSPNIELTPGRSHAIVTIKNQETICRLMNFQDKPLVLSPGQKIGQLE